MRIQLSNHFTYRTLLRFALPSVAMMVFTSIYGVVDGLFVSNFVGKTAFAAVNFIMPFLMILGSIGFMFGTGGCALIAKTLGEGREDKAREIFSMLTLCSAATGVVIASLGIAFLRPITVALGARGAMVEQCVTYGRIILAALPAFMLQQQFQSFFVAAEKPQLGFFVTVGAGVTNMVLDALLVAVIPLGVVGAALATALSQTVGALVPVVYFLRKDVGTLHFVRPRFDGRALLRTCTNGSSELMSNASMSLVGMLYNGQLMAYAGEDGVAAYGVLMYVGFIFVAIFIGYSIGIAPVIGFHYGAANPSELRSLLGKSVRLVAACSLVMLALGEGLAVPLSRLFVGYDAAALSLTVRAFRVSSFQFLFCGLSIFGSGFFTSLNNGPVSAFISFLRTLVFQVAGVLLLPMLWRSDGIWLSVVLAELMSFVITVVCLCAYRKRYGYGRVRSL